MRHQTWEWFSNSPGDTEGQTTDKVNFWGSGGMTFVSPVTGTCTMIVGSMQSDSGTTSTADVSYNGSIIEDDISTNRFTVGPFDVTEDNEIFFGNPDDICLFYSIEFTPGPQLLVVAGGGSGNTIYGGGGGAGGMIATETTIVLNNSYNIVIGEGGVGFHTTKGVGNNGTASQFDYFIASGGGGGGKSTSQSNEENGQNGGSGGGGGGHGYENSELPGDATSGQGNSGGKGAIGVSKSYHRSGGGGGGAGGLGEDGDPNGYGGNGGPAAQWVVDQKWYAAGGGGGTRKENVTSVPSDERGGHGGSGGGVMLGGSGGPTPGVYDGTSAVQNTGSGGGAGWFDTIQSGANGIVKIWLPFSYTYNISHFSNVSGTIIGSSESFIYASTTGSMVTFINPGSGNWTPNSS